jgi:hypothetical protein
MHACLSDFLWMHAFLAG